MGLDGVRRTDWHDYEAMRRDAARSGSTELFADDAVLFLHTHTHTHLYSILHTHCSTPVIFLVS